MIGKSSLTKNLFLAFLLIFVITVAYGWQDFKAGWDSYNCQCDHNSKAIHNE